jgi:hypothetical protein
VLMLRSLGCLESCSLRVLTCDGLHNLLLTSAMPVRCNERNKNYKCKMQDIFWKNELISQNKHIYFGFNHFFLTHIFQKYGIDDLCNKI